MHTEITKNKEGVIMEKVTLNQELKTLKDAGD